MLPLVDSTGHDLTSPPQPRPRSPQSYTPTPSKRRGSLPLLSVFSPASPRSSSPGPPNLSPPTTLPRLQSKGEKRPTNSISVPDLRTAAAAAPSTAPRSTAGSPTSAPKPHSSGHVRSGSRKDSQAIAGAYGAVPVNLCEAWTFPRPRLAAVSPPPSLIEGSELELFVQEEERRLREGGKGKGRAVDPATAPLLGTTTSEREVVFADQGSVRRVLRENKESQEERLGWSEEGRRSRRRSQRRKETSEGRRREESSTDGLGISWGAGGATGSDIDRKIAERRAQREREEREKIGGWNGGEGKGARQRLRSTPTTPTTASRQARPAGGDSPPIALSFEPFTALVDRVRNLSISRHRDRQPSFGGNDVGGGRIGRKDSLSQARQVERKRSASDAQALQSPLTSIRNLPIRHLRSSPSVDSLYLRPNVLSRRMTSEEGSVHVGQAISSAFPTSNSPVPSLPSQNAFLSLPPHLHHLLMPPRDTPHHESFIPSRVAPPIPSDLPFSYTPPSRRHSRTSSESSAALVIALDEKLREEASPTPDDSVQLSLAQFFAPQFPRQDSNNRSLPFPPRPRRTPPNTASGTAPTAPSSESSSSAPPASPALVAMSNLRSRRLGAEAGFPLAWEGEKRHDPTASPTLGRRDEVDDERRAGGGGGRVDTPRSGWSGKSRESGSVGNQSVLNLDDDRSFKDLVRISFFLFSFFFEGKADAWFFTGRSSTGLLLRPESSNPPPRRARTAKASPRRTPRPSNPPPTKPPRPPSQTTSPPRTTR